MDGAVLFGGGRGAHSCTPSTEEATGTKSAGGVQRLGSGAGTAAAYLLPALVGSRRRTASQRAAPRRRDPPCPIRTRRSMMPSALAAPSLPGHEDLAMRLVEPPSVKDVPCTHGGTILRGATHGSGTPAERGCRIWRPRNDRPEASGKKCRDEGTFMNELGAALQVFYGFGDNWNAATEVLRYLDEWLPAARYVLVVEHAEELFREAPDDHDFATFVRVLNEIGEWWASPVVGNGRFDRPARPFRVVLECFGTGLDARIRGLGFPVVVLPQVP